MSLFLKEKKSLIVLIVLVFFQLVLISFQVPLEGKNYFERAIFSIFSPIQHGTASFLDGVSSIWKRYFYLRDVRSQNEKMKKEIFFLRQENNLLRNALQKLMDKEEIKNRISKIHKNILMARVIGLDASNFYNSVTIDKGSLDDLKKDMVVVDRFGNLVGRIVEPITFKESRVQLITDIESGVSVFSQKKRIPGIVIGDGKGRCLLKYIISSARRDVSKGESLLTSGYDGIFPSGLHVGEIISVIYTTSLFKKITVRPYFDFSHLDQVAVLFADPFEIF